MGYHACPSGHRRREAGGDRSVGLQVAFCRMFRKVLVANRGEIAIRAFRAGLRAGRRRRSPCSRTRTATRCTGSKADEAYQIGEPGHPVRAYLSVDEIVRAARRAGADAVYPGYGFLSENPDLAQACADAGHHVRRARRRGAASWPATRPRAVAAAREAGVPVLGSSEPSDRRRRAGRRGRGHRLPAVRQGRRRRRRARDAPGRRARPSCARRIEAAMREAESAFGDPTVFLEQAVVEPAPHRGADPRRRRPGNVDPPLRARLLGAAPAPEGHRDRARAEPRPGAARADLRRRGRVRPAHRLRQRRHRGVPARRATATTSSSR